MPSLRKILNDVILNSAARHLSKDKVVYKSTLHNHFREDGVKTRGRFNIMLCLMLVIQSKYDKYLGVKSVDLDEDEKMIYIRMSLNKPTRLIVYKDEVERELCGMVGKKVRLELKYTNKLYGLDFYNVI